jgi:hypothetical protein
MLYFFLGSKKIPQKLSRGHPNFSLSIGSWSTSCDMKQIPVSYPCHSNSFLQALKMVYAVLIVAVISLFQFLTFCGKQTRLLIKYEMIIEILSFQLIFLLIIAKLQKTKALGTHTSFFRSECTETASLGLLSFSKAQLNE